MVTQDELLMISKEDFVNFSKSLTSDDISQLVEWLSLKDDKVRYQAFLLLQTRAAFADDVYTYLDTFLSKLKSDNSYQRSIGLMLISENIRWDAKNRFEGISDDYLELLNDEKPITIRQCIQSLEKIIVFKPKLTDKITNRLISFDFMNVKETMRKLILLDILNVISVIGKDFRTEEVNSFIINALSGEILDKKSKKQMSELLM